MENNGFTALMTQYLFFGLIWFVPPIYILRRMYRRIKNSGRYAAVWEKAVITLAAVMIAAPVVIGIVSSFLHPKSAPSPTLEDCVNGGNVNLVRAMLEEGAKPDLHYDSVYTPLMTACADGKFAIAKLLVDYGANVNLECKGNSSGYGKGYTALFMAIDGKAPKVLVRILIEAGADVNHVAAGGMTPLEYAKEKLCPRPKNTADPMAFVEWEENLRTHPVLAMLREAGAGDSTLNIPAPTTSPSPTPPPDTATPSPAPDAPTPTPTPAKPDWAAQTGLVSLSTKDFTEGGYTVTGSVTDGKHFYSLELPSPNGKWSLWMDVSANEQEPGEGSDYDHVKLYFEETLILDDYFEYPDLIVDWIDGDRALVGGMFIFNCKSGKNTAAIIPGAFFAADEGKNIKLLAGTVEDYWQNEDYLYNTIYIHDYMMNPGGTKIAYIGGRDDNSEGTGQMQYIYVYDIGKGSLERAYYDTAEYGEWFFIGHWLSDSELVYKKSLSLTGGNFCLYVLDLETGEDREYEMDYEWVDWWVGKNRVFSQGDVWQAMVIGNTYILEPEPGQSFRGSWNGGFFGDWSRYVHIKENDSIILLDFKTRTRWTLELEKLAAEGGVTEQYDSVMIFVEGDSVILSFYEKHNYRGVDSLPSRKVFLKIF